MLISKAFERPTIFGSRTDPPSIRGKLNLVLRAPFHTKKLNRQVRN
jgi:hypothetical protein